MAPPATRGDRKAKHKKNRPKNRRPASAIDHAARIIHAVCGLAGSPTLIDEIRAELKAEKVLTAIRNRETGPVFDWLVASFSYQGISDQVAYDYMQKHGRATWADISNKLAQRPSCPKLRSYWHFHDCRYQKSSGTCSEPDQIALCPLPKHGLRNGHLNQSAYSLYLFIRDIANGDLLDWIDHQLHLTSDEPGPDRLARMRDALIEPLREVFGVSDKVLTMTLSCLLIAAPKSKPPWIQVGGSMIAVDTLVHNFLHRTGILRRFGSNHSFGPACYRPRGCAAIIYSVADRIDARQFNPTFPKVFPRFVQHAIWRYCSQAGLDVCNGNRSDDTKRCGQLNCRARLICDRVALGRNS